MSDKVALVLAVSDRLKHFTDNLNAAKEFELIP